MKLAICLGQGTSAAAIVKRMLSAQTLRPSQTSSIFEIPGGALGYLSGSEGFSSVPLFQRSANGNLLFVSGVPIRTDGSLTAQLDSACDGDYHGAIRHLTVLDGAFAAVFWDAGNERLVIVSDFLGFQPLYIFRSTKVTLLSTELKGIAQSQLLPVKMDPVGWASFISWGHMIGDSTTILDVQRVPPASFMLYDPHAGSLEERTYAAWPAPVRDADIGSVVDCLSSEIAAYAEHNRPGTVLLSGGFDSRLVLAMLGKLDLHPTALIIAHEAERMDADGRFAQRIADRFDVKYSVGRPHGFFSSDDYLDFLVMNEVASISLHLFIAQVSSFLRPEMQAVWDGVCPGHTLTFPPVPRSADLKTYLDIAAYLKKTNPSREAPIWQAAERLFSNGTGTSLYERFQEVLKSEVAKYPSCDAGRLQFIARHGMRNRSAHNPLKVYSNDVLCFTPGTSREFWSLVTGIPYAAKWDFKLYFELFNRYFPKALDVPFCSAGRLRAADGMAGTQYYLSYLFPPPGARELALFLERVGLVSFRRSALFDRILSDVSPDHPDLRADFVRVIQRADHPRNQVVKSARVLLFYWQIWRYVMEGRLKTQVMGGWNPAPMN